jgi:hypothetical protein
MARTIQINISYLQKVIDPANRALFTKISNELLNVRKTRVRFSDIPNRSGKKEFSYVLKRSREEIDGDFAIYLLYAGILSSLVEKKLKKLIFVVSRNSRV